MRSLYIGFQEGLPEDYFYYHGLLLINISLPIETIIEIIKIYLSEVQNEMVAVG